MGSDYSEYLAVQVLNEQQYVSYRSLSRALKVHNNLAKQMLYDFHYKQNSRKPGSVHATYLLSGTKRPPPQANGTQSHDGGEDSVMQSSPPLPSSSMPQPDDDDDDHVESVPVKTMMLVKEENLVAARDQFDNITGMHIYSLQAASPKDMHVLIECNRRIAVDYATEDPLKEWKQYGIIQNASVKRRTGKRPPPPPAAPAPKLETKATAAASAASKSSAAEVNSSLKPSVTNATIEQSNSMTTKPAATKKQESGIFKAFAKGAAAKTKKSNSQQSSAAPSPALKPEVAPEDVPMTGFSDDDLGDDDDDAGSGLPDELEDVKAPTGKSKRDRQAELQAMMDQEDEPMEDANTPATEDEKHDEGAIDTTASQVKEDPNETVTVENGRRRGRRRVMKKKTVKDEEGYLVTKEEPAWESFSEDEPAAKKPKIQVSAGNKPAAGKKGAKPGQGNIMSFFAKK